MNSKLKRDITLFVLAILIMLIILVVDMDEGMLKVAWSLAYILGGYSKAEEGVKLTIENKSLNVEFLMIFAAIGAALIGYYSEGAILIIIFSLSGMLEEYSMNKAQNTLTSLLSLAPDTALLVRENQEDKEVMASSLMVSDVIKVPVGQMISADGQVVSGSTYVNQASITGEYMTVSKEIGDEVYAGTLNEEGSILVEVTKDPTQFLVNRMSGFVLEAKESKTIRQTKIDRFESIYVYLVLIIAALLAVGFPLLNIWTVETAVYRAIVFLVVASPCALVASTAPAMLSAMSWGGKNGILIKGSIPLEHLSETDVILFDKTGTITLGKPMIKTFEVSHLVNRQEVIDVVFALESHSTHPLAKVVVEYLTKQTDVKVEVEIKEVAGKGVSAMINDSLWEVGKFENTPSEFSDMFEASKKGRSIIKVIKNKELVAYFLLQDSIREDAQETLKSLKELSIETYLLTGDYQQSVEPLMEVLEASGYYSDLLPEDKKVIVEKFKSEGKVVTMVGDGINDAPALAVADVGIAMGQGTDVALETADIVFMNNNLDNMIKLVELARKARRIVNQNITFSMTVLVLLVIFNLFEFLTLPVGVLFHEGSTILVILNGLRLLLFKP